MKVPEISEESVEQFARNGALAIESAISAESFQVITGACHRALRRPLPVTRTIRETGWHNVQKVTLFRDPQGVVQQTHSMSRLTPEIVRAAQWADSVVAELGRGLLQFGYNEPSNLLVDHLSNRAIVNRMTGTPDDPAVLGMHTDPDAEVGVNASLTLGDGMDLMTGETVTANTLNLYACRDLSDALGIYQPAHGFSADTTRLSLVFTQFQS